jgi:hypothetical protein
MMLWKSERRPSAVDMGLVTALRNHQMRLD